MTAKKMSLFFSALLFWKLTIAQIPVTSEPHHKIVFENEYVRIIKMNIPAHDSTLAHVHSAASVIVFLSKTKYKIQVTGEPVNVINVNAGDVKYTAYDEKPAEHKVWNLDTPAFRLLVVEVKMIRQCNDTSPLISHPDIQFQWQQKSVRAYTIELNKSKHLNIPKSANGYVLINVSGIVQVASSDHKRMLQT